MNTVYFAGSNVCDQFLDDEEQAELGKLVEGQFVEIPRSISYKPSINKLFCGSMHTLALDRNNSLYSCGCNDDYALGRVAEHEEDYLRFGRVIFPFSYR